MCAERNAAASMITNGERRVVKLACLMGNGSPGMLCGACCEFLMQLDPQNRDIEILVSYPDVHTVKLGDLMPSWWGRSVSMTLYQYDRSRYTRNRSVDSTATGGRSGVGIINVQGVYRSVYR